MKVQSHHLVIECEHVLNETSDEENNIVTTCQHVLDGIHDARYNSDDDDPDETFVCLTCREIADEMGWKYVIPTLKFVCRSCLGV